MGWLSYHGTVSVDPLSPNSDQSLLSPYSFSISTNTQVLRIKKTITREETSWSTTVLGVWENQLREYACWCQGLIGLASVFSALGVHCSYVEIKVTYRKQA